MTPDYLSASAIKTFEVCEARFLAENIERARIASGVAADLGTAAHESLMKWTTEDMMDFDLKLLIDRFNTEAARLSLPEEQCEQGRKMLEGCFNRLRDNPPYEILMVEAREEIEIPISKTESVKFVYIYDRCDRHEDGSIEIVDYKSWFVALDAPTAKKLPQVRMYALTAAIKYKHLNPPAIWVTLDQLRHNTISVKFTKEDLREVYAYFKDVWRRIQESDGTIETVNPECRYCVRNDSCVSLAKVRRVNPDGVLATDDFETIAAQAAETYEAIKALELMQEEYTDWLESYLEELKIPEASTSTGIRVAFSPTTRRKVDSERVARVVGPDISQRYGRFSMEDVDLLLKGDEITPEQKDEIEKLIRRTTTTKVTARYQKK